MPTYSLLSKLQVTPNDHNAVVVKGSLLQLGPVAGSDPWTIVTQGIDPNLHTGGQSHLKVGAKYAQKNESGSVGVVSNQPGDNQKWHLIPVNYEQGYYAIAEKIDTPFPIWTVGEPEGGVRCIWVKAFAGGFADNQIFKFNKLTTGPLLEHEEQV